MEPAGGLVLVHPKGDSSASVSLDPPLVGFCAGSQSTSWPRIRLVASSVAEAVGVAVPGSYREVDVP